MPTTDLTTPSIRYFNDEKGTPWFIGKDVAEALGYANTRDALNKHVDDDDKNTVAIRDGIGNPNKTVINESGVYSLVMSSQLPAAKEFTSYLFCRILQNGVQFFT